MCEHASARHKTLPVEAAAEDELHACNRDRLGTLYGRAMCVAGEKCDPACVYGSEMCAARGNAGNEEKAERGEARGGVKA